MNLKNLKYFEPNDGADPGGDPADKPAEPTTLDAVKLVADKIADAIAANRVAPAPVVVSSDPTVALAAEAAKVNDDYNALMADGKYADAAAMRDSFMARANAASQGDPANNPFVRTAIGLGKKAAKIDYPDVMKKYGAEVEAAVNALPIGDRVQPDAWDRAVSTVKTAHFDEIIKAEREAAIAETTASFVTSGSQGGSRGRKDASANSLDELQLVAAEACGVSPEAYAKRVKAAEDYDKIPVKQRGSYEGYPVVSNEVKPGRF